jgi:hypothetical protein
VVSPERRSVVQVLEAAKAGAAQGVPMVAVMVNGGTISLGWIRDQWADAILNAWLVCPQETFFNSLATNSI